MSWRTLGLWPAAGVGVLVCGALAIMGVHGDTAIREAQHAARATARPPGPEAPADTAERPQRRQPVPPSNHGTSPPLATPPFDAPTLDLDPMDLVSAIIDSMTTDELLDALSEATRRDRRELEDEVEDPRAFAKALALAILSGWATEQPQVDGTLPIRFETRLANLEGDEPGSEIFPSSTSRIFGTFPLEPGQDITVLAKWYRVNPPEFLLLEEVRVLERDGRGFIRLERPEGWPEGVYRLELYESSESVEPLAKGEYRTVGHREPLLAVFD